MKKCIIISDAHLDALEPQHQSYKLVKKFIVDQQPDIIYLNGDMLDFGYLSLYTKDYPLLRENRRLTKDFDLMNKELDFFQSNSNEVIYLEGNHEGRLTRFQESIPSVADGLLDLQHNLSLQKRGVKWYPVDKICHICDDLVVTHGTRFGMNFAKNVLDDMMISTIVGHTHRTQTFSKSFPAINKTVFIYGLGCLSAVNPSYLHGKLSGWTNSFGVAYVSSSYTFYTVPIIDKKFIFNGVLYK
jgi:predicted MPP superfamily phosphohydrolase